MNYLNTFIAIFFLPSILLSQKVVNYSEPVQGLVKLSDEVSIPKINPGYTLWLPEGEDIKGVVVFFHARRDTTQSEPIIDLALARNLGVLYLTTENRVDFLFEESSIRQLADYLLMAVNEQQLPNDRLFFAGMSLAGTRALKFTEYIQTESSYEDLLPKAIAICDSPLDMVRFHKEGTKAKNLKFNEIAANEGAWITAHMESHLGGKPDEYFQNYVAYSPYCYLADGGDNLRSFTDIPVRAYTEPDVAWWMETRAKDYYGMNALDLAAFINELKLLGNDKAALILTQDKGFRPDGSRHPHSWSIVDQEELIGWFLSFR